VVLFSNGTIGPVLGRRQQTAEYIGWFNHRRLHGEIGYRPPIEVENEFLNSTTPSITTMERV
jgi:transposase InsO family protein